MNVTDKLALAQNLANAGLLPRHYQKAPANLLWAIEYAEALGVHPMTAVTGIHVIDGKPTASAQLIGGLVRRAGHKLRVTFDRKAMVATAQIFRADDPDFTFESVWSMDRAKAAGLTNKNVWKQYPDAMLKARAITEVARDAAPEALYGVIYTAEELGAEVELDGDGEIIAVVDSSPTHPQQAAVVNATPVREEPEIVLHDDGTADIRPYQVLVLNAFLDAGYGHDDAKAMARAAWEASGLPFSGTTDAEALDALYDQVVTELANETGAASAAPQVVKGDEDPFTPEAEAA
jgi:hypothetical protein